MQGRGASSGFRSSATCRRTVSTRPFTSSRVVRAMARGEDDIYILIAPALIWDRHRDEPDVTLHTEDSDATTASRREALVAPLVIMGLGSLLTSYPALAEEEELLEARPAAPLLAGGKVSGNGQGCACRVSWT